MDGADATLQDCAVDHSLVVDAHSGSEVEQTIATDAFEVRLVETEGAWKVKDVSVLGSWNGAVECAA